MAPKLLIDSMPFKVTFEESASGKGKLVARGEHSRFDRPTENNRMYPKSVWEVNRNRLQEALKRRRVFGELDHPGDGKTKLQRVSHLTTGFEIDDASGVVLAEDEILDTPNGRILQALVNAGCEIGVSSRGFGSIKTDENGVEVVQDDYRLLGWDFVADPAMRSAYPEIFAEENKIPEGDMDLKTMKKEYPDLYKEIVESAQAEAKEDAEKALTEVKEVSEKTIQEAVDTAKQKVAEDMKEKFTSDLMREVEKVREAAEAAVREELMSDPDVAGAKVALAAVAEAMTPYMIPKDAAEAVKAKDEEIGGLKKSLAEKELEIGQLKHENTELASVAKKAAYTLHLERSLVDEPEETRIAVAELIGKVEEFESTDELEAKVEAIKAELDRRSAPNPDVEAKDEELKKKEAEVETLRKENEDLKGKVLEVANLAKEMRMQVYAATKLSESAYGRDKILQRLVYKAESVEEIDELIAEHEKNAVRDTDEMQRIRSRVQRGKQRDIAEDTDGKTNAGDDGVPAMGADPLAEIGLSMEEVVDASGLNLTEDGQPSA